MENAMEDKRPYAKFRDRHGTEWDLSLTVARAKAVSEYEIDESITPMKVNLLRGDRDLVQELAGNRALVFALAWLISAERATAEGMDEMKWLEGLDGTAMMACEEAFWESLVNFTPSLATFVTTTRSLQEKMMEGAVSRLKEREEELEAASKMAMDQAIDEARSSLTGET